MTILKPYWTDQVKIESGGRYPLLLNRFHSHLEEFLIKGIVFATDRLRYISYCCWIIGDIEENVKPEKYEEFMIAFQRRESALAIGTYLNQPTSILGHYPKYGEDVIMSKYIGNEENFSTTFRILLTQKLGAYGLYYTGSMYNWGLIYRNEKGIELLTESGKELYWMMNNLLSSTDYYKKYKGVDIVPGTVLKELAVTVHYDTILEAKNKNERTFYRNILFHIGDKETTDGRRDSLMMYLEAIMKIDEAGCVFNEDTLRNIIYYKKFLDQFGNVHNLEFSESFKNTVDLWLIYEFQVYFRWWVSEYFKYFLVVLRSNDDGYSVEEVMQMLDRKKFNELISEYLGIVERDFLDMKFTDFTNILSDLYQNKDWFFEEKITNASRIEGLYKTFSENAAGLIMIIAALKLKFKEIENNINFRHLMELGWSDFWFMDILNNGTLLSERVILILEGILRNYIINQHNRAMYAKHDLRRCWIIKSGEKYIHKSDSNSMWRPAKHGTIINFLFDMGLIFKSEKSYHITEEGKTFYNSVMREYYGRQSD